MKVKVSTGGILEAMRALEGILEVGGGGGRAGGCLRSETVLFGCFGGSLSFFRCVLTFNRLD